MVLQPSGPLKLLLNLLEKNICKSTDEYAANKHLKIYIIFFSHISKAAKKNTGYSSYWERCKAE